MTKRTPQIAAVATAAAAVTATGLVVRSRRRRRISLPGHAVIISPRRSTSIAHDGAVSSIQSAELTVSASDLERLWNPSNLENLASTYWHFLTTVTLGIVRVKYDADSRSVCLLIKPLTLLRFDPPQYEFDANHGKVRWQIRDGLLVARPGRKSGHLSVEVVNVLDQPMPPDRAMLRIVVDVSNFYPSIAAGLSTLVYEATQSFIHVLVTHAFLRSLANLELIESKVGRLAVGPDGQLLQPLSISEILADADVSADV